MTITAIEREEAIYNARDVLGMCRMYEPLIEAIERNGVAQVYDTDEQMADLAIQMTRAGMPVNLEKRAAVGQRLTALCEEAIAVLRPYTEGENRESFIQWAARFMAAKARKCEPVAGSMIIGPTRAAAELAEAQANLIAWKGYKKSLAPDALEEQLEADEQIKGFKLLIIERKRDLVLASMYDDASDGLIHTAESAFEARLAIRTAEFTAKIEKHGVNYGAKIQQCAILRAAGVPLIKTTGKSGLPQVDKEVLEGLKRHAAAKAVLQFILVEATLRTYIRGEAREEEQKGGKGRAFTVSENGYVHPLWTVHKITGRWGSSPNCFTGDTEILIRTAEDGPTWTSLAFACQLDAKAHGYQVLEYDPRLGDFSWQEPTRWVFREFYQGPMFRFQGYNIDQCVTEDHRELLCEEAHMVRSQILNYYTARLDRHFELRAGEIWDGYLAQLEKCSSRVGFIAFGNSLTNPPRVHPLLNMEITRVDYAGPVYCLSVPSGFLPVRRNGKISISGQCQNISKRAGGGAENLRAMFEAPEGYTFVGADQKQLEARLIGAMSQCEFLLKVFREGRDIHSEMASVGFPRMWPELYRAYVAHKAQGKCGCEQCKMRDKIRDITKRLEYGGFYGGKDKTLWESVVGDFPDFTMSEVRNFLREFNTKLPEVLAWREQTLKEATFDKCIRSPILGRMQVFPLGRVDPTVAYNYKAQSGGADLWALGAIDFCAKWDQTKADARLIHNGHDSVLILCRVELAPEVEQDVYACWNREWGGVPFEMEAKISPIWSET